MCVKTLYYEKDFVIRGLFDNKLTAKGFEMHSVMEYDPDIRTYDLESYDLLLYADKEVSPDTLKIFREVRAINPTMGIVYICETISKQDLIELYNAGVDKTFLNTTDIDVVVAELGSFRRRLETLNYRLKIGDVSFNVAQQYVEKDNRMVHLNPTEAKLLLRLVDSTEDDIVTNNEIIHLLNQATGYDSTKGTKVYIYRIRKKLDRIKTDKVEIKNKYSNGYYLCVEK